ncbi:hypothetical protein E4U32_000110 [Claviceps aff. humidiphila group G2b]|nr:hypothetical protein E4U32_000110 [Claviceps aff. humidiphila group G2b]
MENPWDSSPWTSDSAPRDFLPVPLPSLPTEPQQIHIASPGEESRLRSASPWGRIVHDETPWGGWGDGPEGKSDAGSVDGWKLGGELTTAAGAVATVVSLPDPWTLEEKEMTGFGGAVDERSADLVISVGDEGRRDGGGEREGMLERVCLPDEVGDGACDDAWAKSCEGQAEGGKEEREDRSASPGLTQLVHTAQTARNEGEEDQEREEIEGGQEREEVEGDRENEVSEESRSGEEMQDSRVQVDDNRQGPKIQEVGNRQASKVQELVHMYDGMARIRVRPVDASLEEVPSSGGDAMVNVATGDHDGGEEDEKGAEAGKPDFEESGHVEERRAEESKEGQESSATEPKTECEVSVTDSTAATTDHPTSVTDSSSRATGTITTQNSPSTVLPYPIDFSNLDELFPGTEPTSSIQPAHLPDSPTDPFSSVAQRKAWYRLSRPGSIRKHNLGDDDTYVRVSWHNSHIRQDVLTTVRRWLEEDSLAGGRMLLGRRLGNRAGASMFNWDSDAPGVHISELLSQKRKMKKGAGHARLASAAVQGTTSPIDASFGWSTSVPTSPLRADTGGSFSSMTERRGEERPSMQRKEVGPDQGVLKEGPWSTTAIKSDTPSLQSPEKAPSVEEDDEDDWGEMVSSPTVDTHHASFHMDMHTRSPSLDTMHAGLSSPAPDLASPSDDFDSHLRSSTNQATQPAVRNVPVATPNPWDGLDFLEGNSAAWATMDNPPPEEVLTSLTTTVDREVSGLGGAGDVGAPSGAELSHAMLSTRTENDIAMSAEIGDGCPPGSTAMSGGAFPIPTNEGHHDLHDGSFPPSSPPPPSIYAVSASSLSIPAKAEPKPPAAPTKTKTTTNLKLSTISKTSTQSTFKVTEAPAIAAAHNPGSTAIEDTPSDGAIQHMLRDLPDLSYMLR